MQMCKTIQKILIYGLFLSFLLVSAGTVVYAEDMDETAVAGEETEGNVMGEIEANETDEYDAVNMTGDDMKQLVAESLLTSMLQHSGANETQTAAVIAAAKDYYADNSTETNTTAPGIDNDTQGLIAGSFLSSLLSQLGVNETVTSVAVDYARTHADEIGDYSNSSYSEE
ncbi:MAG: hypothetical protein JXA44_04530 [Methanospirillaceae archaeon]|nr:hypothetical protein [Methanospirillaceae archaeon]